MGFLWALIPSRANLMALAASAIGIFLFAFGKAQKKQALNEVTSRTLSKRFEKLEEGRKVAKKARTTDLTIDERIERMRNRSTTGDR